MARRFRTRKRVLVGYCTDASSSYNYAVLPVSVGRLLAWRALIRDFAQWRQAICAHEPHGWAANLLYVAYRDYTPYFTTASAIPAVCDEENAFYDYEWKVEAVAAAQAWLCVLDRGSRDQLARCDYCVLRVREDSVQWEANEKYCDNRLGTPTLFLHEIEQLLQTGWFYD